LRNRILSVKPVCGGAGTQGWIFTPQGIFALPLDSLAFSEDTNFTNFHGLNQCQSVEFVFNSY